MSKNKNQHYVPQFHLRAFSSDGRRIQAFLKKQEKLVEHASIRDQCSRPYFYGEDGKIDGFLQLLEQSASKQIAHWQTSDTPGITSVTAWERFLCFLQLQARRTPSEVELGNQAHEGTLRAIARTSPKKDGVEEDIFGGPIDHLSMIRISTLAYAALIDLDCVVAVAPRGHEFITSDCPVVQFNTAAKKHVVADAAAIASAGLQIAFPISPSRCLILYDRGVYKTTKRTAVMQNASAGDVLTLNALQYQNSISCLYGYELPIQEYRRIARLSSARRTRGVRVHAGVLDGREDGIERYRMLKENEEEASHQSIIAVQFIAPEPIKRLSFMPIKLRPKFDRTGTGAGDVRSVKLMDAADRYAEAVKEGDMLPFKFHMMGLND